MQIAQIGPSLQGIFKKTVVAKTAASAVTASAQSEERPPEVWLPSLSDDERLVEEHARSRGVELNMMASLTETCSVGCVSSWWLRRHVVVAASHRRPKFPGRGWFIFCPRGSRPDTPPDHAMRELCARLRARRRAACGRASATVPARDGGRVPFLFSMAAAPLSLASTESGRLGPHRRAAQAGLEHVAVIGVRCCRGECVK